jgi:hypothetical protein
VGDAENFGERRAEKESIYNGDRKAGGNETAGESVCGETGGRKLQAPSSKLQRSSKLQFGMTLPFLLEIGI